MGQCASITADKDATARAGHHRWPALGNKGILSWCHVAPPHAAAPMTTTFQAGLLISKDHFPRPAFTSHFTARRRASCTSVPTGQTANRVVSDADLNRALVARPLLLLPAQAVRRSCSGGAGRGKPLV